MEKEILIESFLQADEEKTDDIYSRFCSGDISIEELQSLYRKLSHTGNAIIQMENLLGRKSHETIKL